MCAIVEKIGLGWTVILGAVMVMAIIKLPEILTAVPKLIVSILISLLSSMWR